MSPVIRSAFRLSRRLDLCNAARAESPDRRHARGHFAIDDGRGIALQIQIFVRDTVRFPTLLSFFFYCSTNGIAYWTHN